MKRGLTVIACGWIAACSPSPFSDVELAEALRPCLSETATGFNALGAAAVSGAQSAELAQKARRYAAGCGRANQTLRSRAPEHPCVVAADFMENVGREMEASFEGRRPFEGSSLSEPGEGTAEALTECVELTRGQIDLPWVFGGP